MTIDEIIEGLKFTVDMFMLNPLTGENLTKLDLNPYNRRAVEACNGAIKRLQSSRPSWISQSGSE